MQSAIPPRPDVLSQFRVRTVAEVIDAAFRAYRRNFLTFLTIMFVILLPVQLLSYAIDIFVLGIYNEPDFTGTATTSTFAAGNVASQLSTLKGYLETFFKYLAQWALTSAIVSMVFARQVSLGSAYRSLGRNLGRALGLILLQGLIVLAIYSPMVCVLALLAFGSTIDNISLLLALGCFSPILGLANLIVDVRLKLALPAAVVEGLTPRKALRRSLELTRNYWWRTFALVIVLGILSTVVAIGPAALLVGLIGIAFQLDIFGTLALTRLIGILTIAIYAPIEMGAIAFYYFDQRVRREGFDLDTAITERYETDYIQADQARHTTGPYDSYTPGQPTLGVGAGHLATATSTSSSDQQATRDLRPPITSEPAIDQAAPGFGSETQDATSQFGPPKPERAEGQP